MCGRVKELAECRVGGAVTRGEAISGGACRVDCRLLEEERSHSGRGVEARKVERRVPTVVCECSEGGCACEEGSRELRVAAHRSEVQERAPRLLLAQTEVRRRRGARAQGREQHGLVVGAVAARKVLLQRSGGREGRGHVPAVARAQHAQCVLEQACRAVVCVCKSATAAACLLW